MLPGIQGLTALLILLQLHWQWHLPQHQLQNSAYKNRKSCPADSLYRQWTASLLPSAHQAHTDKTCQQMTDQTVQPAHDMPDILAQSANVTTQWVTILQNRCKKEENFCYLNIYFLFNYKVRSFITWNEINKNEMNRARTVPTYIMNKKWWNSLLVKLECSTLVRIFRCTLGSNIGMNLNELEVRTWNGFICLSMDANDRLIWVPQKLKNLLDSWTTTAFSQTNVLCNNMVSWLTVQILNNCVVNEWVWSISGTVLSRGKTFQCIYRDRLCSKDLVS